MHLLFSGPRVPSFSHLLGLQMIPQIDLELRSYFDPSRVHSNSQFIFRPRVSICLLRLIKGCRPFEPSLHRPLLFLVRLIEYAARPQPYVRSAGTKPVPASRVLMVCEKTPRRR